MAILTLQQLENAGACAEQRALFAEQFGKQVDVTPALAESVAGMFRWDWAAQHLLPASALAEYERVRASALAEYRRVTDPASAEYERVRASALAEYERVRARTFARLYNQENPK